MEAWGVSVERPEAPPPCGCHASGPDEPYFAQLGTGPSAQALRRLLELRSGLSGASLRLERLAPGQADLCSSSRPLIVLRRASNSERLLCLVRHRPGHTCPWAWLVLGLICWDAVPKALADSLSDLLRSDRRGPTRRFALRTSRRQGSELDARLAAVADILAPLVRRLAPGNLSRAGRPFAAVTADHGPRNGPLGLATLVALGGGRQAGPLLFPKFYVERLEEGQSRRATLSESVQLPPIGSWFRKPLESCLMTTADPNQQEKALGEWPKRHEGAAPGVGVALAHGCVLLLAPDKDLTGGPPQKGPGKPSRLLLTFHRRRSARKRRAKEKEEEEPLQRFLCGPEEF